ncbi:MAG TPA: electron transporter RnfC, partial [Bacteroides sp.]|nr:electron transporter RnfC [Bacteroides sp.]
MKLKTFTMGGVHPPENKLSAGEKIRDLSLPETVVIPVSQHLGAPSKVIVERGEQVKTGQLIARAEGFVSTNIHASVSGKVTKVDVFPDPSGYRRLAVQIKVDGDEWVETIDRSDTLVEEITLEAEEIRKRIL